MLRVLGVGWGGDEDVVGHCMVCVIRVAEP